MKIYSSLILDNINEDVHIDDVSEKLLQLGHEHEINKDIIDFELTPNRGDCLSLKGILRDLNAFYSIKANPDIYKNTIENLDLDFDNCSPKACPSISFLKLEIDESPKKYASYLDDYFNILDNKKNNFFTDISNYLSFETGQPLHCYDYEKIHGKITLKETSKDENFVTLMEQDINLKGKNLTFVSNDQVINLAGIVGSKSTCCDFSTTTVLVECAFFKPEYIIGKSLKYNIKSDAAHKFERGVDPSCHDYVLRRFIQIVKEHASVKSIKKINYNNKEIQNKEIKFNNKKINQILGKEIDIKKQVSILNTLGFEVDDTTIKVPAFRHDIFNLNDIAEEIARVVGYDNFSSCKIKFSQSQIRNNEIHNEQYLKNFLVRNGFNEVINSSFSKNKNKHAISIDNPLDINRSHMRTNLHDSLIDNLIFNEKRQKDSIKLFEISDIYLNDNSVTQARKLGIIASGRVNRNYNEFSKKIDDQFLASLLKNIVDEKHLKVKEYDRSLIKSKSKSKSKIYYIEIDIDQIFFDRLIKKYKTFQINDDFKFNETSDFPSIIRDVSFSLKDKSSIKELQEYLFTYQSNILKEVFVFDFYDNNERNIIKLGFRLIFQSNKATLTDEEVDKIMKKIMNKCIKIKDVEILGLNI